MRWNFVKKQRHSLYRFWASCWINVLFSMHFWEIWLVWMQGWCQIRARTVRSSSNEYFVSWLKPNLSVKMIIFKYFISIVAILTRQSQNRYLLMKASNHQNRGLTLCCTEQWRIMLIIQKYGKSSRNLCYYHMDQLRWKEVKLVK